MARVIHAADLFCGAGGTSTGLAQACRRMGLDLRLVAVNHWDCAIETHAKNHPWASHFCTGLDELKPSKAVPGRKLDLLVASPECTHHSVARGGKPCDDQSRASAWHVLHWCQELHVRNVIIENVPEFTQWGPLDERGRPLKSRRGDTFQAFLTAMRSLGYQLDWRFLTAADYGDATTRRRFFLLATRGRKALPWPVATHLAGQGGLQLGLPSWRPASEVIDWTIPGHSIFLTREDVRKHGLKIQRPLAPNTLRRIEAGIRKFWGKWAEPFIAAIGQTGSHGGCVRSVDAPLGTLVTKAERCLVRPFMVPFFGEAAGQSPRCQDMAGPLAAVTGHGAGGIVQPLVMQVAHTDASGRFRQVDTPLPTVSGNRGSFGVMQPLILSYRGNHSGQDDGNDRNFPVSEPLRTQDTSNRYGVLQPFILNQDQRGRDRMSGEPLSTIVTRCSHGLVRPFVIKYNRTGGAYDVGAPLDAITTDDRYGLVRPMLVEVDGQRYLFDILFRMLAVKELAAAHSFPSDYFFAGNKSEQVKQIGNSVPVKESEALCESVLRELVA